MILSYDIAVDLTPEFNRQLSPKFSVSLGDHGAREYTVKILQGGEPYEIEEGSTVSIVGKKQDGHIFAYACTYADEYVYFAIEEQMTPVSGIVTCELSIIDASGNKVGSANFTYWVEPSPVTDGEASESDLQIFQQAIDAAAEIRDDVDAMVSTFGGPNVAETAAEMTDTKKVYVYTGSETGYTYGHWYYYDKSDSVWKSGGVYQSQGVVTDKTLTVNDVPADAKATGEALALKQDTLTFDPTPTEGSTNPVTSNGIYSALASNLAKRVIARNTDIDTLFNTGIYTVSTASNAATMTNWPCTGKNTGNPVAGTLFVFSQREPDSGVSYGIGQIAISLDQMWFREWRNSVWNPWVFVHNSIYTDTTPTENSNRVVSSGGIYSALQPFVSAAEVAKQAVLQSLFGVKFYGHLFIDGIAQDATPIVPSESLYEVQYTKRLGFKVIEGHLQKTLDNKYIVMHGVNSNIGYELVTTETGDFTPDVAISSLTLADIKANYVYRSSDPKYRTPVCSADEWLTACKIAGLTPLVMCPDDDAVALVRSYCGNDFILYNGTRAQHSGIIFFYQYNLGANVAEAKAAIDDIYETYGSPLIIETFTITQFTDAEFAEVVQYAHNKGVIFGTANCYYNTQTSRIVRAQLAGCDIAAAGWEVPDFDSGNIVNLTDATEFTSEGSITDGVLNLTNGQTITIPAQQLVKLGKGVLKIRYSGRITVNMGGYYSYGTTTGRRYDSDGTQELFFSTYFLNEAPDITITALANTSVQSVVYRASAV